MKMPIDVALPRLNSNFYFFIPFYIRLQYLSANLKYFSLNNKTKFVSDFSSAGKENLQDQTTNFTFIYLIFN